MTFTLQTLTDIIEAKAKEDPSRSYTAQLMQSGTERCAKKLGEEAIETVIAAIQGDKKALTAEAADLVYHLLVLLRQADIDLSDVLQELERRTKQSGLTEKASRPLKS